MTKMRNLKGCFMHNTDHWATPKKMYKYFMDNGYIDPCPLHCNVDNCSKRYSNKKIYINPPYSQIAEWVYFIQNNYYRNEEIILLIPARTDTKYFHQLLELNPTIEFIKGRLKFNDAKTTAPFPSIILKFKRFKLTKNYKGIEQKDYE